MSRRAKKLPAWTPDSIVLQKRPRRPANKWSAATRTKKQLHIFWRPKAGKQGKHEARPIWAQPPIRNGLAISEISNPILEENQLKSAPSLLEGKTFHPFVEQPRLTLWHCSIQRHFESEKKSMYFFGPRSNGLVLNSPSRMLQNSLTNQTWPSLSFSLAT